MPIFNPVFTQNTLSNVLAGLIVAIILIVVGALSFVFVSTTTTSILIILLVISTSFLWYFYNLLTALNAKILLIDDAGFNIVNSWFNDNSRFSSAFETEKRRLIENILYTSEAVMKIGITPFHERKITSSVSVVYLIDKQSKELVLKYHRTINLEIPDSVKRIKIGESITGWAAKDNKSIWKQLQKEWINHSNSFLPINSAYSIPLISNGEIYGVLTIGVQSVSPVFRSIDKYVLRLLAKKITFILTHDHTHCMLYKYGWRDGPFVREVGFAFQHELNFSKVVLIGTFNGWNDKINIMEKKSNKWQYQLGLPEGDYYYRYRCIDNDGKVYEIPDPNRPNGFIDAFGLPCSTITV